MNAQHTIAFHRGLWRMGATAACLLATRFAAAQGAPPAAVKVDAARMEQVQERRLVTGELRAVQRSRVATEEPGVVLEVPVIAGQVVKKGEVLARLDQRRLGLELAQARADHEVAEADVAEREADLEWRRNDLSNYEQLSAGGAGKVKELFDARMEVRIAEAKLASARRAVEAIAARVELVNKRIGDTTIVAPFDGVVVSRIAEAGEWLSQGSAVAEVLATASVDAWLDVPQQYAQAMNSGTPRVIINLEASGAQIETSDLRVIPQVDGKARTFAVVARIDNAGGTLAPGMTITAYVPTGAQAERLTVSRDAIMRNNVGAFVYVARQTDPKSPPAAIPADVRVLFAAGERVVVESPALEPGALLVVEGNERLFPTAPIIPQPVDGEPAQSNAQP